MECEHPKFTYQKSDLPVCDDCGFSPPAPKPINVLIKEAMESAYKDGYEQCKLDRIKQFSDAVDEAVIEGKK